MRISGRAPRSFNHLCASSCGFRPFDPGIIQNKLYHTLGIMEICGCHKKAVWNASPPLQASFCCIADFKRIPYTTKKPETKQFQAFQACVKGFEPSTFWSVARRSIQLSYTHIFCYVTRNIMYFIWFSTLCQYLNLIFYADILYFIFISIKTILQISYRIPAMKHALSRNSI